MTRSRLDGAAPFFQILTFGLSVVNGVTWFCAALWTDVYGLPRPAGSWVQPVHFNHGVVVYVPRALGLYIACGLLAELFLLIVGTVLSSYYGGAVEAGRKISIPELSSGKSGRRVSPLGPISYQAVFEDRRFVGGSSRCDFGWQTLFDAVSAFAPFPA